MHGRAGRSAGAALIGALVTAFVVAGCSVTDPTPVATPPPTAEPASVPAGVSVSVFQTRADVPTRRLEISITNETAAAIVVTGARFDSSQFVAPADWTVRDSATIRPGTTVNLPVQLSAADCSSSRAEHKVRLSFVQDGPKVAEVLPLDRFDRLPALRAEDCLAQSVETIAMLALAGPLSTTVIGGTLVGSLGLEIVPTGASGSLTLVSMRGAILMALADPASGAIIESRGLNLEVDAAGRPSLIMVDFVPNRCDPHAIAEDKRGTLLPVEVSMGKVDGVYSVPVSDELRSEIYAYLVEACGMAG
ncbi:hypothetical protein ABIB15_002204 [Marisediminicola sp. UYEF4]|uniref:hypothetical protein n=1 Tax=Marisediminicola sp. UYEF4 TaxID=1756384 RepID=UPI00339830B8